MIDDATSEEIPLFPLQSVLFPDGPLPLRIFEPRYVDLVGRCLKSQSGFGVVLILDGGEVGEVAALADVGTHALIEDFNPLADGLLGIFCRGGRRFRLLHRRQAGDGLHVGTVEWLPAAGHPPLPPQYAPLAQLLEQVLPELGALYENVPRRLDDADWVGCRLAEILPIEQREKQRLLEVGPIERLVNLAPLLQPSDCHTDAP